MLVDSVNVEVTRQGCAAKLVMRGPVMGLELKLTAADLEALAAYLQREAVSLRRDQPPNYYAILGLSRTASAAEIKRAYRKLARAHHPDLQTGGEEKLKTINAAYAVLNDPKQREQYDSTL